MMQKQVFRFCLTAFLLIGLFPQTSQTAENSNGPGFVPPPVVAIPIVDPGPAISLSLDFKKQDLFSQKKIKARLESKLVDVPNLDPLISEIIRQAELENEAHTIMPWVYGCLTEMFIVDFEDALQNIDAAGDCLDRAMFNAFDDHGSIGLDLDLGQAKKRLDDAEFTIMFLVEIAKLEL